MLQTQNFSNLAHRQSLGGHRTSLAFLAKGTVPQLTADVEPTFRPPQRWPAWLGIGGRLPSERVARLARNHRPLCLGIRTLREQCDGGAVLKPYERKLGRDCGLAICHDCVLRSERAKRRRSPFGIVPSENAEVEELRDWKVDCGDIRADPGIAREISGFIEKHRVLSVTMTDGVFGCPHQEGNNYEGEIVPNLHRQRSCRRRTS